MSVDTVLSLLGPQTTARDILVSAATGRGIDLYGGQGARVEACQVAGTTNAGIYVDNGGDKAWVVDNLVNSSAGDGIQIVGGASTVTAVHVMGNTVDCSGDGVAVDAVTSGTSENHVILGNIVAGSHTNGISVGSGVGTVIVAANISDGHSGTAVSDAGDNTLIIGDTTGSQGFNQSDTSGAVPVITLTQADVDEDFFKFIGTSDTNVDRALVDAADFTTPGSIAGWLKINIQDDQGTGPITDGDYYIPFYTAPSA